jgi:hypothetical protein
VLVSLLVLLEIWLLLLFGWGLCQVRLLRLLHIVMLIICMYEYIYTTTTCVVDNAACVQATEIGAGKEDALSKPGNIHIHVCILYIFIYI